MRIGGKDRYKLQLLVQKGFDEMKAAQMLLKHKCKLTLAYEALLREKRDRAQMMKKVEEFQEKLEKVEVLKKCTPEEMAELAGCLKKQLASHGTKIYERGQIGDKLFIVL